MAGRPRPDTPERRRRIPASKARWRDTNREYYRAQKRKLTNRPEYKERRKELKAQEKAKPPPPALAPEETTLWAYYNASTDPEVAF